MDYLPSFLGFIGLFSVFYNQVLCETRRHEWGEGLCKAFILCTLTHCVIVCPLSVPLHSRLLLLLESSFPWRVLWLWNIQSSVSNRTQATNTRCKLWPHQNWTLYQGWFWISWLSFWCETNISTNVQWEKCLRTPSAWCPVEGHSALWNGNQCIPWYCCCMYSG
jgi:hypothetical protein